LIRFLDGSSFLGTPPELYTYLGYGN